VRADALLVPVQPRAVDVWALRDIAELVTQAQESRADDGRKPLRALAVLNLADPGANADTQDALAALASYPQLVPVAEPIRRRKAVANAMAHGLAVAELLPRDAKACAEMAALTEAVFAIKEQSYGNHAASKPKQVG
jgi:chromosome partitioning protein